MIRNTAHLEVLLHEGTLSLRERDTWIDIFGSLVFGSFLCALGCLTLVGLLRVRLEPGKEILGVMGIAFFVAVLGLLPLLCGLSEMLILRGVTVDSPAGMITTSAFVRGGIRLFARQYKLSDFSRIELRRVRPSAFHGSHTDVWLCGTRSIAIARFREQNEAERLGIKVAEASQLQLVVGI
jgi:hypothetical protein